MGIRQVPPSIKDPNLAGFLRELRAAVGGVSDQVTKLIQTKSSSGGGGGTDPGTNPPDPSKPPVGDGYPPPPPTSLQAIPAAFSVTLVWTNPVIADLQATEVWGRRSFDAWNASYEYLANAKVLVNGTVYRSRKAQDVNSTTNVVTLNKGFPPATSPTWWEATTLAPTDKSKIGESGGTSWIHDKLTPGETWAYWVRNRDIEDLYSTFFPADDIGVITTTLLDPKAYLDLLTNSITATQLYRDLGQRINLIDGPQELIGSVNARTTAVYNELDGVIDKIVDGSTDITVKTPTGFTTLRALKTSTEDSSAAIVQINKVDATSTSANAQVLFGLKADVKDPTTGLAAAQAYIAELNNVSATSTSANATALWGIRAKVNDPATGLEKAVANINAINDIKVTSTSAAAQKIANLDATVNTGPNNLAGQILALNDVSATSTSANAKALFQVQALNSTKISVFFQTNAPGNTTANPRVTGDLWYDTDDNNKQYKWNGTGWEVFRDATKTYSQTTAPTSTAANPLYVGDLWIDTTLETVNGTQQPKNIQYRWSGSSWQDVSKGLTKAEQAALITNLEQTKIGYATLNATGETFDGGGLIVDKASADAWNASHPSQLVTWRVGLPVAKAVKQVSVTVPGVCYIDGVKSGHTSRAACEAAKGAWTDGSSAALEQNFTAQQEVNGRLYSQYTLKLDTNGWVSGFGLANAQQADGTVVSDFGIRADRFWLAPPNSPLTAQGGPGTRLVDLGSGSVVRVTTIYGVLGGVNGTFDIAYAQVGDLNGQSVKSLTGLDNYNPFTTTVNPNARRWISLRNVRAANNTTTLLDAWNQAFVPVAVGNFYWLDYRYNTWTYASSLPGVTDASRVVVLGVAPSTLPTYQWGYSIPATDTVNDPAKIVADNLLPFIVTTTAKKYNGVDIPAGVFINNAFIANAMLGKAVMTGVIGSDNFVAGASGWQIDYAGNAEFNTVIVRTKNIEENAATVHRIARQAYSVNVSNSNGAYTSIPGVTITVPLTATGFSEDLLITGYVKAAVGRNDPMRANVRVAYNYSGTWYYLKYESPTKIPSADVSGGTEYAFVTSDITNVAYMYNAGYSSVQFRLEATVAGADAARAFTDGTLSIIQLKR